MSVNDDVRDALRDEGYSDDEIDEIIAMPDATEDDEPEPDEQPKQYESLPEGKSEEDMLSLIKEQVSKEFLNSGESTARGVHALNHKLTIKDDRFGLPDVKGLSREVLKKELDKHRADLASGDLSRVEGMLFDQSHTLQAMFTHYLQLAAVSTNIEHIEALARIALKAQNQCRQSLSTLGDLKNPKRATFIKQQNNAMNQQIDNEKPKKIINSTNKLSGAEHEQVLDSRAKKTAV